MQLHLDTLASEQTSNLIANLGLQPICTMVAEHQNARSVPLAKGGRSRWRPTSALRAGLERFFVFAVPGMEEPLLREFLSKFDGFLVAPDVFLLPQTRLLASSTHRKSVTRRSLEVVAASYGQLYHAVVEDPQGG